MHTSAIASPTSDARVDAAPRPERAPVADRLPRFPLFALAFATFTSVTVEMMPTGLMPLMAPDLGVSDAQIGLLMTIFAFTVVVTSAPLTALTRRIPRHVLLVSVLGLFSLSVLGTALAPSYELVVATRVVTGLGHGLFWAVVASYTALITPKALLTKAISITLGGGGAAFVLGVPIGTALGQLLGWRLAFATLAVIAFVVAVVLWRILPRVNHLDPALYTRPVAIAPGRDAAADGGPGAGGGRGAGALRRPRAVNPRSRTAVLLVTAFTAFTMVGQYAFFSYVSSYALDVSGFPVASLSLVLFAYGVASALGTALTGALWTKRPRTGLYTAFALMLGGVLGLVLFAGNPLASIVPVLMWGLGMGFLPPLMQVRILLASPSSFRDLASAIYSSGFNVGIGGGAFVGGLVLQSAGIREVALFFLAVVSAGIVFAVVLDLLFSRGRRSHDAYERSLAGGAEDARDALEAQPVPVMTQPIRLPLD